MADIFLMEIQQAEQLTQLHRELEQWGFQVHLGGGRGTVIIAADRPDPDLIPSQAIEVLWWVKDATPEDVSEVLARRAGWVIRQSLPLENVKTALNHLQHRDLGSEGWLRQMLYMASLDELLRLVLVRAEQLSGAQYGAVWVRQDDAFFQRCGEGFPEAPLSQTQANELVSQGQAWFLCPGTEMGVLCLKNPQGDPELYLNWIKDVEGVLLNAWNVETSTALSFRDDLTVALNRRALEVDLPRIIREAAARGEFVSLLFLDVDNLKALNSQFGHPTGSKVIAHIALEAQRVIRAQDRLYRYGGDEFCIVIPGTTTQGAVKMGERLLQTLQTTPVPLGECMLPVSTSIGIATYPTHADGAEHLLERADRALYQAKADGKARIVLAD